MTEREKFEIGAEVQWAPAARAMRFQAGDNVGKITAVLNHGLVRAKFPSREFYVHEDELVAINKKPRRRVAASDEVLDEDRNRESLRHEENIEDEEPDQLPPPTRAADDMRQEMKLRRGADGEEVAK